MVQLLRSNATSLDGPFCHLISKSFSRGLWTWPPCFFALRRKNTKWTMRAADSGFFGLMNLRNKKKPFTFMNWAAINVTSAWTWRNFNQVMRTENVMKITFIRLFVNVCKFMLCITSWKLEHLIAQLRKYFTYLLTNKATRTALPS